VAGRAADAWFRRTGQAVKTGAVTVGWAAGVWFRRAGPAVKSRAITAGWAFRAILRNSLGPFIKDHLKKIPGCETPADRYRLFAGAAVLLVFFLVNISLLKQPDAPLFFPGITDRTLVFTQWWETSLDAGVLEGLIGEFERQNPDIRVTLDTRSYTEVRGLLTGTDNAAAAGRTPDILGIDPLWLGETAVTERLEPLPRHYKRSENSGSFYTGGESPYEEWGRPLVSFMMPLFYNIDLLEKAGFDRPPKDQADFAAFAKAVTGPDSYGFAIALSPEDPQGLYRDILPWILSSASSPDSGGKGPFNMAAITAALNFLNGLQKDGSLAPGSFTKTGKDRVGEFMAGRVVMLIASMADARLLRSAGFNCGITAIPLRDAYSGKPLYALEQWYAGISRDTRYKEDALLFIDFLSDQAPGLSEYSGSIPWNGNPGGGYTGGSNADGSYAGEYPLLSKAYDIYYTGETRTNYAKEWQSSLFEKAITEELRLMLEGGRSPADTAKAIQSTINR
jgi:multiple sugar transport system substrate-binding protein